jgi:hypothetical protein
MKASFKAIIFSQATEFPIFNHQVKNKFPIMELISFQITADLADRGL